GEVLDIALKGEPRGCLPIEPKADEFTVAAGVADSILQLRERPIQPDAQLFVREESAANVDGATQLAKAVCEPAHGSEIDRPRTLGNQIDDSGGAGNTEHQRIGPLQGFDLLFVLRWNGQDAGSR